MTDEDDPRPYDPEELDDDELDLDGEIDEANAPHVTDDDTDDAEDTDAVDDELPDVLPRGMPPGSAAELDEEPERLDPDEIEP